MKSIILFSDGTGNSAGSPHKTNVWRVYKALNVNSTPKQVSFYDDGVGTSSNSLIKILGLVFGLGLARNVKSIYRFVCRSYREGDKIYGFGFSRGAFTMRVVIALISEQGLVNPTNLDENDFNKKVDLAYIEFRKKAFKTSFFFFILKYLPMWKTGEALTEQDVRRPDIEMLGVWDTVDAYGMPIDEMRRAWDKVIFPLAARDRNCSNKVKFAYHALALDEQRLSFSPILWNEDEEASCQDDKCRITQVWFPGVHADIGGGYPDASFSYISLNWMIKNADKHGLVFDQAIVENYENSADINGPMHDSRGGIGFAYRFEPRHVEALCRETIPDISTSVWQRFLRFAEKGKSDENRVYIEIPKIHHSVLKRLISESSNYAPINIPSAYTLVDDDNKAIEDVILPGGEVAERRRDAQGRLWNLVAARKLIYVCNSFLVVLFAALAFHNHNFTFKIVDWLRAAVQYLMENTLATLIVGTVGSLLWLGGKFKTQLHSKMEKIWRLSMRSDKGSMNDEDLLDKTRILSQAIYDDRIKSGNLVLSPVSKFINATRFVGEIACFILIFLGIVYLLGLVLRFLDLNNIWSVSIALILPVAIIFRLSKIIDS